MFKTKPHSLSNEISLEKMPNDHPARLFNDYWVELCRGEKFALKGDFDPSKVTSILPNIAVIAMGKLGAETDLVIKLAGEKFYQMGKVSSGQRLKEILSDVEYKARCNLCEKLAKDPQATFFDMHVPIKGFEFVKIFQGVFPFSSDGKAIDHIFIVID